LNDVATPLPLSPARGLVTAETRAGAAVHITDLHRWVHYVSRLYDLPKVDVLMRTVDTDRLLNVVAYAREFQTAISLRTDAATPPPDLAPLVDAGLFDVFLAPDRIHAGPIEAWLEACQSAGLPIRMQWAAPWPLPGAPETSSRGWAAAGVRAVTFVVDDPCGA